MHHVRRIVLVGLFCLIAGHVFAADDPAADRLVGFWLEYGGSHENLARFTADGGVSMYLRQGEIGDLRTLDGKWTLTRDGTITMTFRRDDGTSVAQSAKLGFVGDDMTLTEEDGTVTRHHRHTGPLPAWTQC